MSSKGFEVLPLLADIIVALDQKLSLSLKTLLCVVGHIFKPDPSVLVPEYHPIGMYQVMSPES